MSDDPRHRDVALRHGIELDRFQLEAMDHIDAGRNVLVAAPTSAGKTVVAEHAIDVALAAGRRIFYTTPIKALSNQKWRDLRAWLGAERVGLLTGDNVVAPDAPVVVMTTEVLRNMLWAGSDALDDLGVVVLDEVHYLMDDHRGPVWEEVILNLAAPVRLVCLSATVSNAAEVADWLEAVRDDTAVVVESERPVPLRNEFLVGDRATGQLRRFPTLDERGRPNPRVVRLLRSGDEPRRGGGGGRSRRRVFSPRRLEIVEHLGGDGLLPAIYFIFSRNGCDEAARACLEAGFGFTEPHEVEAIDAIVAQHVRGLGPDELTALDYERWVETLRHGIAAHHAGLVPPFKEAVEEAFAAGLLRVVFATETLALGVNLPARTVVLEALSRYRGDGHEPLRPADYTQLTGRAGRRGIDEEGHAVAVWSRWVRFEHVAELATSRDFELRSAFRPTWNMAANLVAHHDRTGAHALLGRSFAQFRADRGLLRRRTRLERRRAGLAAYEAELREAGHDPDELYALATADTQEVGGQAGRRWLLEASLARLRPGDVIDDGDGRPVVVLSRAHRSSGLRLQAVTAKGRVRSLSARDFDSPVDRLASVPLPEPYAPGAGAFQKETADRLRSLGLAGRDQGAGRLGRHDIAERRRAEELRRRRDDIGHIEQSLGASGHDLPARFDALIGELERRGYVEHWELTRAGRRLARVFHEADLLVVEAIEAGVFDGLQPAELAALVSTLVHEHRGPDAPPPPWFPPGPLAERFRELSRIADGIRRFEAGHQLPETRRPDAGLVAVAYGWTLGGELGDVLDERAELTGGDFVRRIRSLIDLLGHIASVADEPLATTARQAAGGLDRGLVAAANRLEP